jgi:serine/threonine protein kinase
LEHRIHTGNFAAYIGAGWDFSARAPDRAIPKVQHGVASITLGKGRAMSLDEWITVSSDKKVGGQGYVQKVHHISDGRDGALKRLHGEASMQTERRYRFLTEVGGLRAMAGNGVPRVLEANENQWENKNVELYVVMEFIDGPTMAELVQSAPPTVDDALVCAIRILSILAAGHQLSLNHRDLKPDNVMVQKGRWGDPILVDLGIAWHRPNADAVFRTPADRELGNRFLRLPEFAPGGEHRDPRSDLAMAAGLLFFLLSSRAPRVLIDHKGRHPHEVIPSPIRTEVLMDKRWPRLSSLLRVAFQQRLEHRFRDADEFATRLFQLNEDPSMEVDGLELEVARFRDLTESSVARERAEAAPSMEKANKDLCSALDETWRTVGLQWGGQNPVFKNAGATNEFYCVVSRKDHTDPYVVFRHKIELSDGRISASWQIDEGAPTMSFEGPAADHDAMREAMLRKARNLAGLVVGQLNTKLQPASDLRPFFS